MEEDIDQVIKVQKQTPWPGCSAASALTGVVCQRHLSLAGGGCLFFFPNSSKSNRIITGICVSVGDNY